jgi:hypothetical protein
MIKEMLNAREAKSFLKRHESLVKIINDIGFCVSDDTNNHLYSYVVYHSAHTNNIQKYIQEEMTSGYAKKPGPYVYASDEKELVLIVRGLLLTYGKNLHMDMNTNFYAE